MAVYLLMSLLLLRRLLLPLLLLLLLLLLPRLGRLLFLLLCCSYGPQHPECHIASAASNVQVLHAGKWPKCFDKAGQVHTSRDTRAETHTWLCRSTSNTR